MVALEGRKGKAFAMEYMVRMERPAEKAGEKIEKAVRKDPGNIAGKLSWATTILGTAACILFVIYGLQEGLFSSQEAMARFLSKFGIWGPLVFVAIQVVQVVIPIIPGGVSCLVGVLLFGPIWGFIYNYTGICIGSACAFQIARKVGMPAVERAAGNQKIGKYMKWMENGTFDKLFAAAIFFPAAPDDLLCFLAGVTKMSFRKFLLIILLGKPMSIALYSVGLQLVFQQFLQLFA